MKEPIIRFAYNFFYLLRTFFLTFRIWTFKNWISFWLSTKNETKIVVNNLKFIIRTKKISFKLADIYMVLTCVFDQDYNPRPIFDIKKSDIIIDIGAHIGSFSVFSAKLGSNGFVYSFEPSIENYKQLEKNVKLNNIKNIKLFNRAVSSKRGKIRLYYSKLNTAANNINLESKKYDLVDTIPLKDIFILNNIKKCDFLKMDCEGAEYEILLNTNRSTFNKIQKIACEYHVKYYGIKNEKYTVKNIKNHLKENGFKLFIKRVSSYEGMIYAFKPLNPINEDNSNDIEKN